MTVPSDPFRELAYFHRRMDRLLQESLGEGRRAARQGEMALEQAPWNPAVTVYREVEEIVVFVELPGISSTKDVLLELEGDLLTISGVRPAPAVEDRAEQLVGEGHYGPFLRRMHLPEDVDTSAIKAQMKSGVLEIRASIRKPRGYRRVQIVTLE